MKFKNLQILLVFLLLPLMHLNAQNYWSNTMLTKFGPVKTVAFNKAGHMYAGLSNGVIKSIDKGVTWTKISDKVQGTMDVHTICINSLDEIFACSMLRGIYKSADGGATWKLLTTGDGNDRYTALSINKAGKIYLGSLGKIYKSGDGGQSWVKVTGGLDPLKEVSKIYTVIDGKLIIGIRDEGIRLSDDDGDSYTEINKTEFGTYNSECFTVSGNGTYYAGFRIRGLWRSTDQGATWVRQYPGFVNNDYTPTGIVMVSSNYIVVSTAKDGVCYSINDGDNWIVCYEDIKNSPLELLGINGVKQVFAFSSTAGLYMTSAKGTNWAIINKDLLTFPVYTLKQNKTNMMFAGAKGNMYSSSDKGKKWDSCGLPGKNVFSIAFNNTIMLVATNASVFRSADNGKTFKGVYSTIGPISVNSVFYTRAGKAFACLSASEGLYSSTDNGDSWLSLGDSIPEKKIKFMFENVNGALFAATETKGVIKSMDTGRTWRQVPALKGIIASDIEQGPGNFLYLSATGTNNGIYQSIDNGDSWKLHDALALSSDVNDLTVNKEGFLFAALDKGGVAVSIDEGENWKYVNSGLGTSNMLSIAVNQDNFLFTGTPLGVYTSTNISSDSPYNIPEPPTGLAITRVNMTFKVTWKASTSANVVYRVYRKDEFNQEYVLLADNVAALEYVDNTIGADTTYTYAVSSLWKAKNKESDMSAEVSAKISSVLLAPPLVKSTPLLNKIKIEWEASLSIGTLTYRVYRSIESGKNYEKIAETDLLTYTDETATESIKYFYIIRTVSQDGTKESPNSVEVFATPSAAPQPPSNLIIKTTLTSIILEWTKSPSSNISYRIYRSVNDAKHYINLNPDELYKKLNYEDLDVTTDKMYYYYVKSYNDPMILESVGKTNEVAGKPGTVASVLEEISGFSTFSVSPNPATDKVTLSFDSKEVSNLTMKLINAEGKTVSNLGNFLTNQGKNSISLEVGTIASGAYYLMVESANDAMIIPVSIAR